jgi:predicted  nucleic acid-binding Zn-ribbon protein
MATEKTPAHKRAARAEQSSTDWKMKAIERREEIESLKGQLVKANETIKCQAVALSESTNQYANLQKQIDILTKKLEDSCLRTAAVQLELAEFKKKPFR